MEDLHKVIMIKHTIVIISNEMIIMIIITIIHRTLRQSGESFRRLTNSLSQMLQMVKRGELYLVI